jgi:hypothetical protein
MGARPFGPNPEERARYAPRRDDVEATREDGSPQVPSVRTCPCGDSTTLTAAPSFIAWPCQ